jgi:hypothetical protein
VGLLKFISDVFIPSPPEPDNELVAARTKAHEELSKFEQRVSSLDMGFFEHQNISHINFTSEWNEIAKGMWGKEILIEGFTDTIGTLVAIKAVAGCVRWPHFHQRAEILPFLSGKAEMRVWEPLPEHVAKETVEGEALPARMLTNSKYRDITICPGNSISLKPYQPHDMKVIEDAYFLIIWEPAIMSAQISLGDLKKGTTVDR